MDISEFKWTREPAKCSIGEDRIEITTSPHTDLWQRTYYHFQNDNAPVFQMSTEEKFFSFVVKTDFTKSHHRFDQCGIVMYLRTGSKVRSSMRMRSTSTLGLSQLTMATRTGRLRRYRQMSGKCGTASAVGRMITVLNARGTERTSRR